jgi:uncharacterized membrane protein YhaH (DUF805 family)
MERVIQFLNVIKKDIFGITEYKTRSRRSEYFFWYLVVVVASILIGIIVGFIMEFVSVLGEIILSLFLIFVFAVSLPLGIRRLHDIGKKTWFILIGLIPIVGQIILLVFFCKDSQKESNQWGESPKNEVVSNEELMDAKPIEMEMS